MQYSTVQIITVRAAPPVPSGRALIAASSETREADRSSFNLDCFSSVPPSSIDSSKVILRKCICTYGMWERMSVHVNVCVDVDVCVRLCIQLLVCVFTSMCVCVCVSLTLTVSMHERYF